MRLVIADVEAGALAAATAQLEAEGAEVLPIPLDVSDRAAPEDAARRSEERFGNVNLVCTESKRNRPARFARTEYVPDPSRRELSVAMIKGGMDPLAVGAAVRDAVVADELWVLTHPELEPYVAERHESVLAAIKPRSAATVR
jgi:NAD(P)-dependent dehydrogenase (short-subunit alcohol dehydrogenase family)